MQLTELNKLPVRELIAELRTYHNGINGNEAVYSLTAADTTAIGNAIDALEAGSDEFELKWAAALAARVRRDSFRKAVNVLYRAQAKRARLAVGNDGAKLAAIGMEAYDTTPTSLDAPESPPFALIDYGILRHTIRFRDSATPDRRAKPKGVLGCEVWSKIGGPEPTADGDFSMIGLSTSSPFIVNYAMADAGKRVWYRLRWLSKNGKKSGWSETIDATING